jgi:carbon-monoxide dehydrogenase medium subunit
MKPIDFTLEQPADLDEAVAMLAEYTDDCQIIAGGQSLIPLLNYRLARPDRLVDVSRIAELHGIRADNDAVVIGAMVTYAELLRSSEVARAIPLLPLTLPSVANIAVRNRGTIGGSAAHADPAGEMPAVLTALDAEFSIRSTRGARTVGAADFFHGIFDTDLDSDEIITSIRIPAAKPCTGFATREVSRRHGDFALVGAFAAVDVGSGGAMTAVSLSMSGVASTPLRLRTVEEYLVGNRDEPGVRAKAQQLARELLKPVGVLHATADYRREVGSYWQFRRPSKRMTVSSQQHRSNK